MQFEYFLILALTIAAKCYAETKWVWDRGYDSDPYATIRRDDYKRESTAYRYPSSYLPYERDRIREIERIRDLERQRELRDRDRNRHRDRDREPITVRPYTRPTGGGQEDFDDYDIDDPPKYGYDQFRPGYGGGGVGSGGGGVNNGGRPYELPQIPPNVQNSRPNPQNGILTGPEGPTGSIGRPGYIGPGSNRLQLTHGLLNPNDLRPNPANGVLVGPGGPTGIIGRPGYGVGGGGAGSGNGYPLINSQGYPPTQGINPIRPGIGAGLYPNPTSAYPNPGNGIYGYPTGPNVGSGGGIGPYGNGNIYPGQYPATGVGGVNQQQGQYGFYPSQYYPINPYGAQNGLGGQRPYLYPSNNQLGGDGYGGGNDYYAPGYDGFGRSASTAGKAAKDKDKDSVKYEDRKVKKSIDDKLFQI